MQAAIEKMSQDERLQVRLAFMLIPLAQTTRQQLEIMRAVDRADFEPAVNRAIETARRLMAEQGSFTQDEALVEVWDDYAVEVDASQFPTIFAPAPSTAADAVESKIAQRWILTPKYHNRDTRWTYEGSELDILPRWEQAQKTAATAKGS